MEMVTEAEEIIIEEVESIVDEGCGESNGRGHALAASPILTHTSLPAIVPSLCYRYQHS